MNRNPVLDLLTSQQFILTLVGLIVGVVIAAVPALEPVQAEMIASLTAIILVAIGGVSYHQGQVVKLQAAQVERETASIQAAHVADRAGYIEQAVSAPSSSYFDTQRARMAALYAFDDVLNADGMNDLPALRGRLREMISAESRYMG